MSSHEDESDGEATTSTITVERKRRRKRKKCVSARTSRRRVREDLAELAECGSGVDVASSSGGCEVNTVAQHAEVYINCAMDVEGSSNQDTPIELCPIGDSSTDVGNVNQSSVETEEWFEALDFGTLNLNCEFCMPCSCLCCEICRHGSSGEDCIHCDKCQKGDEWSDCSAGDTSRENDENDQVSEDDVILSGEGALHYAMKNDLIAISLKHNLTHTVLEDILLFLRKYNVGKFPKSPKTLMKTPHTTVTRAVPPGQYWHNGLKKLIVSYVKETRCSNVDIKIRYDGIPIAKSSGSSFSPISCMFNDSTEVYLIGVYHGTEKPSDANDLLMDFVQEVVPLCKNGLQCGNEAVTVRVVCAICDAPAKAAILKVKGHGAYFGCSKCTVEGEYLDNRMSYADLHAPLRTDDSFKQQEQEEYHVGRSILEEIPSFGLVTCIPLDYMHLVLLGVMRKLIYMWLSGPLCVRLRASMVNTLSQALVQLVPWVPKEFVRRTVSLKFVKRYKATEFRQILFYTGPVVFIDILPCELYQHFLVLHVAISLLAHPKFHVTHLDYARELLIYFVQTFSELYGQQYISHNVHGLIHLADDVAKFGPVDKFSAFPFENFYQSLTKMVRKGEKPLQQIARRYGEIEDMDSRRHKAVPTNNHKAVPTNNQEGYSFRGSHSSGPLLHGCMSPQYSQCIIGGGITIRTCEANCCCALSDGSVILVTNFAYHSASKDMMMIGRKFCLMEDVYSVPCPSSLLGIYFVSRPSEQQMWPVKSISKKCFRMPFRNGFVVIPLLHCEQSL